MDKSLKDLSHPFAPSGMGQHSTVPVYSSLLLKALLQYRFHPTAHSSLKIKLLLTWAQPYRAGRCCNIPYLSPPGAPRCSPHGLRGGTQTGAPGAARPWLRARWCSGTGQNRLEKVGEGWNWLKQVGTGWHRLEQLDVAMAAPALAPSGPALYPNDADLAPTMRAAA